jgi:carbon-monoxide dehydrogenase large subunit
VNRRWIGESVRRVEDARLLRGAGCFVSDIDRPGQLHAVFVRSPLAHARLSAVDVQAARALPGVAAVLTDRDVPPGPLPAFLWDRPPPKLVEAVRPEVRPGNQPLLAGDRVRYVGQAIALVLAESRYVAEDAAELVSIDYEPLPTVASVEEALAE